MSSKEETLRERLKKMRKVKTSLTLDLKVAEWLGTFDNKSAAANEILKDAMTSMQKEGS